MAEQGCKNGGGNGAPRVVEVGKQRGVGLGSVLAQVHHPINDGGYRAECHVAGAPKPYKFSPDAIFLGGELQAGEVGGVELVIWARQMG